MVAFFGRTQIGTLYSGNGSGGANVVGCGTILEECEKRGLMAEPLLKGFYQYKAETEPVTEQDEFDWTKVSEMVNSGIMYEIFGKYRPPLEEYEVLDTLIYQAAEKTDTAVPVSYTHLDVYKRQMFVRGIEEAKVALESPYGTIVSHWSCRDGKIQVEIHVPANTSRCV